MREIGNIITWNPVIEGQLSNPTVTYATQVGRIIRIGQNLVYMYVNIQANLGWSGGSGAFRISTPSLAGGFSPLLYQIPISGGRMANGAVVGDLIGFEGGKIAFYNLAGNNIDFSAMSTLSPISVVVNQIFTI